MIIRLASIASLLAVTSSAARFCVNSNQLCVTTTFITSQKAMLFEISTTVKGWVAIGLGSAMSGSDIITAFSLPNGSPVIQNRFSTGYTVPDLSKTQTIKVIAVPATFNNTAPNAKQKPLVYRFLRPVVATPGDSTSKPLGTPGKPIDLVWAYSTTQRLKAASDVLQQHDVFSTTPVRIDLFSGSSLSSATSTSRQSFIFWHALLMGVAWMVMSPSAIFIARFLKQHLGTKWFRLHWGLFTLVFILCTVAFVLGISGTLRHFVSTHGIVGVLVFAMMVVQTGLGVAIDRLFDPDRSSIPWYDKAHWWLGRLTMLMSLANIGLGIALMSDNKLNGSVSLAVMYGLFGAALGVILIANGVAQWRLGQSHHQEHSSSVGADSYYNNRYSDNGMRSPDFYPKPQQVNYI